MAAQMFGGVRYCMCFCLLSARWSAVNHGFAGPFAQVSGAELPDAAPTAVTLHQAGVPLVGVHESQTSPTFQTSAPAGGVGIAVLGAQVTDGRCASVPPDTRN